MGSGILPTARIGPGRTDGPGPARIVARQRDCGLQVVRESRAVNAFASGELHLEQHDCRLVRKAILLRQHDCRQRSHVVLVDASRISVFFSRLSFSSRHVSVKRSTRAKSNQVNLFFR